MSSVGCSTVTLQHDGSERANWWDQSRVAEGIKIRSGEKKEGKTVPLQTRSPRTSPYFHSVNILSCSEGVIKQWALLVDGIDVLETSSRWLQSFINENELCLNSFSPCVFLFFNHSVIRFSVFASTCSYFVFPPSGFCFLSLSQSVCRFYISVSNFMPPQHVLAFSLPFSLSPPQVTLHGVSIEFSMLWAATAKQLLLWGFGYEHTVGDYSQPTDGVCCILSVNKHVSGHS